ncbi:MAG: hypothetical protein EA379_05855 [Phycisphaerales bacterium]|nr:MAG: hypothetical protein EA379_05855 [Phycisphaerales bacterium]
MSTIVPDPTRATNQPPSPRRGGALPRSRAPVVEPLERRILLSAVTLWNDARLFSFLDDDGDQVTVRLLGPGVASLIFNDDPSEGADLSRIELRDTNHKSALHISVQQAGEGDGRTTLGSLFAGAVGTLRLDGVRLVGEGVHVRGELGALSADSLEAGAGVRAFAGAGAGGGARIDLIAAAPSSSVRVFGDIASLRVHGDGSGLRVWAENVGEVSIGGAANGLIVDAAQRIGRVDLHDGATGVHLRAGERIGEVHARADVDGASTISAGARIESVRIDGGIHDSLLMAGTILGPGFTLEGAAFNVGTIGEVVVGADVVDSIISAGGAPGPDLRFRDGDILRGGEIARLHVGGLIVGEHSEHVNPGIYAATLGAIHVDGYDLTDKPRSGVGVVGSAVIDPLPSPGVALIEADVERIIEQAVAQARRLGVNATIVLMDREGTVLGAVRMTDGALASAPTTTTITGGGSGGLEGVSVPSAMAAATKAGTAAFLSSNGNAFTTRTAGFIIQPNFPPQIRNKPSGPLFGVQFSNLPTSDINRLPLGLAADPGGVPLYRDGQLLGGIGVELDGQYTAELTRKGKQTAEERIALAGQIGFEAPRQIRGDRVFVEGVRLAYQRGNPDRIRRLTPFIEPFANQEAAGRLEVITQPRVSDATIFTTTALGGRLGETIGDLASSRYSAVAVGENALFGVRERADLSTQLVRINASTGAATVLATIGGVNAPGARLDPGERVLSLVYDDAGTPGVTGDDAHFVVSEQGRVVRYNANTGASTPAETVANPDAVLRDAAYFDNAGSPAMIGVSVTTGQLFRVDLTDVTNPASFAALTSVGAGAVQSFTVGPSAVFAVRESGPQRQLVRINPNTAALTVLRNLTAPGSDVGAPHQRFGAIAYDDKGTGDPADDAIVLQNSVTGEQFMLSPANGATLAPGEALADPIGALAQGRILVAGPDRFLVGVSPLTDRVARVNIASPGAPAGVAEITPNDAAALTRAGRLNQGEHLSQADVQEALRRAHDLNAMLRAQIRKDRPQVSQVTVSVVDAEGNLLGVFRSPDAPVFGFDVSVQKARTAVTMSRLDTGDLLRNAEGGAFASFADRANAIGLALDGSVAISDRAGGFLARPFLPDGIPGTTPGPFSIAPGEVFSVFNTGLQTQLLITNLVGYLNEYASAGSDGEALRLFNAGLLGARGVTDPSLPIANGLQIFPGSVPLYRNGVLVGGIGVSGDGIEQDDFVAFVGATNLQEYGAVVTADQVMVDTSGRSIRLPYVKFPRSPFGGF